MVVGAHNHRDEEINYEIKVSVRYIENWFDIIKCLTEEDDNSEFVFGIDAEKPMCLALTGYNSKSGKLIGFK